MTDGFNGSPALDLLQARLPAILERVFEWPGDWDAYLDARDEAPFDDAWCKAERVLRTGKAALANHERAALEARIDRLTELAYRQVFRLTDSPELAASVSDDFGLIGEMLGLGIAQPWAAGLLQCYLQGRVPAGDVAPFDGDLAAAIRAA